MSSKRYNIEVEIDNVKVDHRYFSFDYKVTEGGTIKREEKYYSDHAWGMDFKSFENILNDHYAFHCALQKAFP
jgi:hypothetical protein